MEKFGTGSIKFKTALVVAFLLAAMAMLIYFLSSDTDKNYRSLQIAQCRSLVDFETERTNGYIKMLEANARELALLGELYYRDGGRSQTLWRYAVINNFRINTLAIGGGLWFEPYALNSSSKRNCYYAYRNEGRLMIDEAYGSEEYNYHNQDWYTSISKQLLEREENKNTAWSRPYYDAAGTHTYMTTVGSGIFNDWGELVGMSTVDWQLDAIADAIAEIKPTPSSFALFADPTHDIVIWINDPEFTAYHSGLSLFTIEWYKPDAPHIRAMTYKGRDYLSFFSTLDNGMVFVVNVPQDELFGEIDGDVREMVIALAASCTLLALLIYLMLDKFVNKPVAYLSAKAEEIGAGNLDADIRIDTRDEFGHLADTLSAMTHNIKNHIRDLKTVTAEKERITTELDIATEIQTSLLPTIFPPFPERAEFDLYANMHPAREVGGDFYDFFMIDSNRLAVVIADVSGKGVPAALFMVIARTLIKNHAQLALSPSEIFERTNEQLCENNDTGMFVTAFMGVLDVRTGDLTYVNAGHNPPLYAPAGAPFAYMEVRPGFVLGGMEGIKYSSSTLRLRDGDRLFLYTDGVTEAEDAHHALFGEERLLAALNEREANPHDLSDILKRVTTATDAFVANAPQSDDMTMLAMVYNGR